MNAGAALLFWGCAMLVAYAYVGYPVVLWVCARVFGRRAVPREPRDAELPTVSLLIAAHNEAAVIRARIDNALALDYPQGKLDVVVASDGSTDATAAIVRSYAEVGVRLLDYHPNRGKSSTLNSAWDELKTDVVLLSDANTFTDREAPRRLARWFLDPSVGAVCGRLVLTDAATGRNVDGIYWRYETFLKLHEAPLDALLGANGAIYAIRREAYVPIPPDTAVDDFVIPLLAKLTHGTRLVYDAAAIAREETAAGVGDEFKRRARIGAGGFQSLRVLWPLLHPRHGWLAWSLLSHKILRWLCPFFLLGMLASSAVLVAHPFYRGALIAQALFYGLAWLGARTEGRGAFSKIARLATLFTGMNAALLVGFWRWLTGKQRGTWTRTARVETAADRRRAA